MCGCCWLVLSKSSPRLSQDEWWSLHVRETMKASNRLSGSHTISMLQEDSKLQTQTWSHCSWSKEKNWGASVAFSSPGQIYGHCGEAAPESDNTACVRARVSSLPTSGALLSKGVLRVQRERKPWRGRCTEFTPRVLHPSHGADPARLLINHRSLTARQHWLILWGDGAVSASSAKWHAPSAPRGAFKGNSKSSSFQAELGRRQDWESLLGQSKEKCFCLNGLISCS